MRRWLPFLVPFVSVLLLAVVAWLFSSRDVAPTGPPTPVTFDSIDLGQGFVSLKGMAHYSSAITQTIPGGLLGESKTTYVFGFFPENDTPGRAIPVLVRTSRKPPRMVAFEFLTVEGLVGPLDPNKVPPSTETMLSDRSEYFFDDFVVLLEAVRVRSEDGVWEEP